MDTLRHLTEKRDRLQSLKPFPPELEKNLADWYRVELTYSSNAIEGNTLSRIETAEVLNKGISAVISGKPLKDQLEAINHAKALEFVQELSLKRKSHQFITEHDIKEIHRIILTGINDAWAGKYRQIDIFIRGSDAQFPAPHAIAYQIQEFITWLQGQQGNHPVRIAADAHYKFVTIHPFIDGNGRTTRLLMNLILLMNGYPMAIIRNEDRIEYLRSFEIARKQNDMQPFYTIVERAIEHSLDIYLTALTGEKQTKTAAKKSLLKIGELAKLVGETVPTIRHWTKEGLLQVIEYTKGGYQLYDNNTVTQAAKIRTLQDTKRLTLKEIKKELEK